MKKKVLGALLSVAMVASLLVGCGGSDTAVTGAVSGSVVLSFCNGIVCTRNSEVVEPDKGGNQKAVAAR